MTFILSNDEIDRLLNITDVLNALEEAYREVFWNAILGSRADLNTITPHANSVYQLKSMSSNT